MKDFNTLGNIQIARDYILFSINPEIYNLDCIKKSAKMILKKACVILDGNPKTEILVELRPRKGIKNKNLIEEFNGYLIKNAL